MINDIDDTEEFREQCSLHRFVFYHVFTGSRTSTQLSNIHVYARSTFQLHSCIFQCISFVTTSAHCDTKNNANEIDIIRIYNVMHDNVDQCC